jgi:hypothetical protein
MAKRLEYRGAFKALDPEGTKYFLDLFQVMHDGPKERACGVMLYRTADGQAVNRIGDGVYEIEESRITLQILDAAPH